MVGWQDGGGLGFDEDHLFPFNFSRIIPSLVMRQLITLSPAFFFFLAHSFGIIFLLDIWMGFFIGCHER